MTIRKTGATTGEITEAGPLPGIPQEQSVTASARREGESPHFAGPGPWAPADEEALAGENQAADQGDDS